MKNILMILGLVLLALTSGCGGLYGRGRMGAYGGVGYGSGPYGSGGVGGPMAAGPMVGIPGSTVGALPVGARGRISPYGGSVYMGTGYVNPELTMMAAARRAEWMAASAAVPAVPLAESPCEGEGCPVPVAAPDPRDERIEALEDQVVELLARDAD